MKTTIGLPVLMLLAVLAGSDARAQNNFWAVDDSAWSGANNGTSWNDAFLELQGALQVAQAGDWILVAEGTYRPDFDPVTNTYTENRSATFQLKNGVAIFGGFPNHGNGDRDPRTHPTVLTGDIDGPEATNHSYHVVTVGPGISAWLEGVYVRHGRADVAVPNDRGGGILIQGGSSPTLRQVQVESNEGVYGAGIHNDGSPILEDMTIASNRASVTGGGMVNVYGSPQLRDVFFYANVAGAEGGGFVTQWGAPQIVNSRFLFNRGTRGGAIVNWAGGGSLTLESVEISNNVATEDFGGGIFNWQSPLALNNVTVTENGALVAGGGIHYMSNGEMATMRNSIVWGNFGGNMAGNPGALPITVSHSLIGGGYPGESIVDGDPLFRGDGPDFRLKKGSPAIGAGDPATCAATEIRDMFRDDACDVGAFEYLGTPGTWSSNGEVDFVRMSPSYWTLDASPSQLSVDDFTVPQGMTCRITGVRGVMQDGTAVPDAFATLFPDSGGVPWIAGQSILGYAETYCADQSASCTQDSDCPGSTCIIPGKHFGTRDGEFLWEPHVETSIPVRLTPGRYWVGFQGYVELGSAGFAYSLSAGDAAVQGSPYELCDYMSPCVYGSPAAGDLPRDLALDIDAVCQLDADEDFSATGVDCDDNNPNRFPGNPEICDGIDNDCDLIADTGSAPAASPTLTMTRTQLSWNAVPNAAGYDIVRGGLEELRSSGGDFGTSACQDNDVVGTTYEIGDGIPHGLGVWYLIRTASPCGNTSYDEGSPGQVGSRDAEITASGYDCP